MERDGAGFGRAEAIFREHELSFWLAVVQLEHGELLLEKEGADEAAPLLADARATFERLGAVPWLERTARASASGREAEPVAGS